MRVWEQAGHSGSLTVKLPADFRATRAVPVNLRGEPAGDAVKIATAVVHLQARRLRSGQFPVGMISDEDRPESWWPTVCDRRGHFGFAEKANAMKREFLTTTGALVLRCLVVALVMVAPPSAQAVWIEDGNPGQCDHRHRVKPVQRGDRPRGIWWTDRECRTGSTITTARRRRCGTARNARADQRSRGLARVAGVGPF